MTENKNIVLLVEDNVKLNESNRRALELEGYRVHTALTLKEAREHLERCNPDIILLDVMLPDGDGIDFCKEIRDDVSSNIFFLTAKTEHEDKIRGLGFGGDDYITKPFMLDEMLARVNAAMRRRETSKVLPQTINKGRLVLDTVAMRAYIDGADLGLKSVEYKLLLFLVQNEGKFMNAKTIYEKVWGQLMGKDGNSFKKSVSDLRKKIEPSGYAIKNVYGKGEYVFERFS